ncbi:MAG TPA: EsaB/YukD family protein [Ktedonobacteraceae bacterium]
MQTVQILIEENAYGGVRPMEVVATAPIAALVPAIVEELKLPQTDLFGNKLVYLLRYPSGGPVLPENKSLAASGIDAGARLALDSYVMEGSVATLFQSDQAHTQPAFYSSQTMADVESFPELGKDTSASFPAVGQRRKDRRWTRRAFLVLGGAALGAGSLGFGYAAYRSLVTPSTTQSTMYAPAMTAKTQPATTQPALPAKATAMLVFSQHQQTVRSVTWSPDGKMLASGANDARLLVWDMNGTVQVQKPQTGAVRAVAWSQDGQQLAVGAANKVMFINPMNGTALAQPAQTHTAAVTTLAWSPRKPLQLVSGGLDNRAVVWNTTTYTPQTIFDGHTTAIESVSWASDGQTVGSSSHGGVVRVWNAGNGQQVHGFFMDAQLPMRAVSFASSGGQLAVGGDDGIVRLWNGLVCQQQVQVPFGTQCLDKPQLLHAHTDRVRALAWSPDARFLATGGDDGMLVIWYPGQLQTPLLKVKHDRPVLALAWSSSGKAVATASGNSVTIWGLY